MTLRWRTFYIYCCLIQYANLRTNAIELPITPAEESNDVDESYQVLIKNARSRLLQFIEKETYQLSGFDDVATVPITYPIDICLMELNNVLYASCLHVEPLDNGNQTAFKIFKQVPSPVPLNDYELIFSMAVNGATGMDCGTIGSTGFVIVVKEIDGSADDPNDFSHASPMIQVKDEQASVVQYFSQPQQSTAHLQRAGNGMYLLQTFHSKGTDVHQCPIYKWSETTFNEIDALPCTNAMRAEAFILDHEVYVAFANHMDEFGRTETYSVIFKFDLQQRKFNLLQQMKTYGATDIKYFQLNSTHAIERFIIVANTFGSNAKVAANAIIYKYNGEKFLPFQILNFDAPIKQFLPVSSKNGGFVLLIALEHKVSKTFQFDGHVFVETMIKFTGGSFGRGVSSMRTYQLDHDEIIVMANSEMLRDATNLFRPKYTVKIARDIGNAISRFDGWYDRTKQKLRGDRLDELFDEIENLRIPIDINVGKVSVNRSQIQTVRTDEVKSANFAANRKLMATGMQMADDIFTRNVLASMKSDPNPPDQMVSASTIVPIHVIDELIVAERVNVLQTINNRPIDEFLFVENNLILNALSVDRLIVNDANNLADIHAKLLTLRAPRRRRDLDSGIASSLHVNQLFVAGRLNGMDLSDLQEYALRVNAMQQAMEATVRADIVSAKVVKVRSNIISQQNLADLVSIKENSTIITHNIRFMQPIVVNELNVMSRLNHIQVRNNRFDALFRRTKGVQVISGAKVFESIKLLEPILQQGKIDIRSPILARIKPMVNIDQDIELHGDYSISGNVTIENLLAASNLFGRSVRFSAKELQEDGLRIDEPTVNVPIEFAQPIMVERIAAETSLNGVPIHKFVKRDFEDIQRVTGKKTFSGDLMVENGLCDAFAINGINLAKLDETTLKKNAENQVVTGSIHFSRILVDDIQYRSLRFGKRSIEQLLTRNTDQIITGNITINGNVLVTNNTGISIRHLSTNNDVFGVSLDFMLADCVERIASQPPHLVATKLISHMYIGHLVVETNFWQSNRSTAAIKTLYESLRYGITMDGDNIVLNNQFAIGQMTATETINGMASSSFGLDWLLIETDQTFTVAQSFTGVTIEDDVSLAGYINNFDLKRLYHETLWRNTMQRVYLDDVVFENVIVEGAVKLTGRWSGLRLPDDIIVRNSSQVQNVNVPLVCDKSVRIYGELRIEDTLNRHNYSRMCDLITKNEYSPHGLTVVGDAIFMSDPSIKNLNDRLFSELLAGTWFVDDAFVRFDAINLRFAQVTLQRSMKLSGKVNGHDLIDLNARYLSLTKPQQISAVLRFQNDVRFKRPVTVTDGSVSLNGDLIVDERYDNPNLRYFSENVLTKMPGTQTIRGEWKFVDINIGGRLRSTRINNLDFTNDIVRFSRPEMNIVRATKTFNDLSIRHFACREHCTVMGVALGEWIGNAVLRNNNYTVQGTIYLRNSVISHVEALGTVNGMRFGADSILLKRKQQRINGNVYIGNETMPLQKLTFDHIYLNYLNGHNFGDFEKSLVQRPSPMQRPIVASVIGNMRFTEPVTIGNLECFGQVNGVNFSSLGASEYNRMNELYRTMIPELSTMADAFVGAAQAKIFDRMVLRQTLSPKAIQKLFKLNELQRSNGDTLYVVLDVEADVKRVRFLGWSDVTKRLAPAEELTLNLPNEVLIDLSFVAFDSMDLIIVQTQSDTDFTQSFYRSNGNGFAKVYHLESLNRTEIVSAPFVTDDHNCIILYNHEVPTSFDILAVNVQNETSADLEMSHLDTQETDQLRQLTAGNGQILVTLDVHDVLTVIDYKFKPQKLRLSMRNASKLSAKSFGPTLFIAVSVVSANRSATAIEMYRYSTNNLELMQKLEPDGPVAQCGFAEFASNEFIFIVQMIDASITFYKYRGIAGFQMAHDIQINGTAVTSDRPSFSLAENRGGDLQLMAINTGQEVGIVEFIFH